MRTYTLNELEKLSGIMAATIRAWERRYDILHAKRTGTNRRWYDDDDLRRLINISMVYHSGIKISKIARFSEHELEEKVQSLTADHAESDRYISSLITATLSFNGQSVNEILLRSIINNGFEQTFTGVVFPFLKRIGILWVTGSSIIGAEHFVSNIFRMRLISAIDSLPPGNSPGRKRVLLFLPDNELHDLGLLFYAWLIRSWGHETLYLGQATPIHALLDVKEKWASDFLVTGALSHLAVPDIKTYLHYLSDTFPQNKILVSGSLADEAVTPGLSNIFIIRTADDIKRFFI